MASSAMSFRPNSVLGLVREGASCSIRPSAHQDGSDLPELRGCQASTMGTRPAWTRLGGEPPQWGWHHWARGRPSSTMCLRAGLAASGRGFTRLAWLGWLQCWIVYFSVIMLCRFFFLSTTSTSVAVYTST
jgi:hypothetical protein